MAETKNLFIIETAPCVTPHISVAWVASDKELAEAKKERPDLIFRLADDLPSDKEVIVDYSDNNMAGERDISADSNVTRNRGITVRGMTLPHNIEQLAADILKGK